MALRCRRPGTSLRCRHLNRAGARRGADAHAGRSDGDRTARGLVDGHRLTSDADSADAGRTSVSRDAEPHVTSPVAALSRRDDDPIRGGRCRPGTASRRTNGRRAGRRRRRGSIGQRVDRETASRRLCHRHDATGDRHRSGSCRTIRCGDLQCHDAWTAARRAASERDPRHSTLGRPGAAGRGRHCDFTRAAGGADVEGVGADAIAAPRTLLHLHGLTGDGQRSGALRSAEGIDMERDRPGSSPWRPETIVIHGTSDVAVQAHCALVVVT